MHRDEGLAPEKLTHYMMVSSIAFGTLYAAGLLMILLAAFVDRRSNVPRSIPEHDESERGSDNQ